MRFLLPLLGLAQIPLQSPPQELRSGMSANFTFKEGPNVFSPKDLVELARPGTGIANDAGDLVLVPVSKYSFADKKNHQFIYLAPLESTIQPLEILLANGGASFWINSRTVAHAVQNKEEKILELYALSIKFETAAGTLAVSDPPILIGKLPTSSASNFRYSDNHLVFTDYVYPDGNLSAVKEHDAAYEKRGNTALVYDSTYVRHWDVWIGPKRSSVFSVKLVQYADNKWSLGPEFTNVLGTNHSTPVEPFGGSEDFDVINKRLVYTAKDPFLPEAMHTKQNIYITDLQGGNGPKELTSGKQGATHNPVFNSRGDKLAWLELDKDRVESDRAKIVIYDLKKDVRFTLTQDWDRSPDSLAFSKEGEFIYFTAGAEAKVKVFVIPVPPTPEHSTTHPVLAHKYKPVMLTNSRSASGIQILSNGRLIFTQSSFTSPNDIFVIHGLANMQADIERENGTNSVLFKGKIEQITEFTKEALKGKDLNEAEEFWFKGARNLDVHGWTLKPKGWKAGEKKKWPAVLLIHGGPQGAWEDKWSTRWNPNVFAQQGYFTIAMNPTGSTTFGQEFTDAITEDWGGKPIEDMQKGWKYVLNAYPEIDSERAVAAGASWGGYAINWIQGHPEYGFGFKALVCHDGVFDSTYNGFSTDELFFFNHEWGGRPWESKSKALSEKYNPTNYVQNWSTPQLLIHGSKDYRLPETESIGAFHALQQRNIPSRLVIFPDENHFVLNHGNSVKWHYEVFRWFDEFVGEKE